MNYRWITGQVIHSYVGAMHETTLDWDGCAEVARRLPGAELTELSYLDGYRLFT